LKSFSLKAEVSDSSENEINDKFFSELSYIFLSTSIIYLLKLINYKQRQFFTNLNL